MRNGNKKAAEHLARGLSVMFSPATGGNQAAGCNWGLQRPVISLR